MFKKVLSLFRKEVPVKLGPAKMEYRRAWLMKTLKRSQILYNRTIEKMA